MLNKTNKQSKVITGALQVNTTKSQNKGKIALFIFRARASLEIGVVACSLEGGKLHLELLRGPGRMRKAFHAACLCSLGKICNGDFIVRQIVFSVSCTLKYK